MKATTSELISLVAGEVDAQTLAARHGVPVEVVTGWRSAFLAGLRSGEAARSRPRWSRLFLATVLVVGTFAFAQTLTPMVADQPAKADDVNGNFNLLKQWLEAKVGAVGSNVGVGTGNISTTGSITGGSIATPGNLNATGSIIGGSLVSNADVRMGSTFAPRADENLRIIRGTVTNTGITGSGFTATGGGTATQTITFTRPFSSVPTVLCSVGPGAPSADACNFVSISTTGFVSTTGIRNVAFVPLNITFVAIGPN